MMASNESVLADISLKVIKLVCGYIREIRIGYSVCNITVIPSSIIKLCITFYQISFD